MISSTECLDFLTTCLIVTWLSWVLIKFMHFSTYLHTRRLQCEISYTCIEIMAWIRNSQRVALTPISWDTALISPVEHWSSEAKWMKICVESTLFPLIPYIFSFHLTNHSQSDDRCFNACDSTKAFGEHACYLAGTIATKVLQLWHREVSANFKGNFKF